MNSPRHTELNKLENIKSNIQSIEERIDTRLPTQYQHLLAFICGWKWRLDTLSRHEQLEYIKYETIMKKLRMEVGAFEYQVKEQGELLTRSLCELDNILSHGDQHIKDTRKGLVVSIQEVLERADVLKAKAMKFRAFTDDILARVHAPTEPDVSMEQPDEGDNNVVNEATTSEIEKDTEVVNNKEDDISMECDEQEEGVTNTMDAAVAEDAEEVEDTLENAEDEEEMQDEDEDAEEEEEDNEGEDDNEEEEENEDEDEDEDEKEEVKNTCCQQPSSNSITNSIHDYISSLPLWHPYYQLQKRNDGLYLSARLQGADPRFLRVQVLPHQQALRITGVKFPTQRDQYLTQFTGKPTYGRFEIVQQVPSEMFDLEDCTQQLSPDGTLHIRIPYYPMYPRQIFRRVTPFQPYRLAVW